jgi:hypothetical protein
MSDKSPELKRLVSEDTMEGNVEAYREKIAHHEEAAAEATT